MHVPEELKKEIVPMNILMIGPTGTGKTEIARRMSSMVHAPFVKVEATKYTEVGIVGQSAEECIKDLASKAYKMELDKKRKSIEPLVKEKVETELLARIPGSASTRDRDNYIQRLRDGEFEDTLVDVQGFNLKIKMVAPCLDLEYLEQILPLHLGIRMLVQAKKRYRKEEIACLRRKEFAD
eukprot:UN32494